VDSFTSFFSEKVVWATSLYFVRGITTLDYRTQNIHGISWLKMQAVLLKMKAVLLKIKEWDSLHFQWAQVLCLHNLVSSTVFSVFLLAVPEHANRAKSYYRCPKTLHFHRKQPFPHPLSHCPPMKALVIAEWVDKNIPSDVLT